MSLFFILSHRIEAKHNQYHIAGAGALRVKCQLRRRLKSPGGKLQDARVHLRWPHTAPSPPAAASCGIARIHPGPLASRGSVSSSSGELRERSSPPSSAPCGSVSSRSGKLSISGEPHGSTRRAQLLARCNSTSIAFE
jgi:hypothetical protein